MFGRRKDTVFLKLKALFEPFGITPYSTDGWGASDRHVEAEKHTVGKEKTQKIARKHSNLRTRIKRLVRRTKGLREPQFIDEHFAGTIRKTPIFVGKKEARRAR